MIARTVAASRARGRGGSRGSDRSTARYALSRVAIATTALAVGPGVAAATTAPSGQSGTALLQTGGGIPVLGPTVILLGAVLLAVGLRLVERVYGPMSSWGADAGNAGTTRTAGRTTTSGSTAGRPVDGDDTTARRGSTGAETAASSTPGVGASRGTHASRDDGVEHATGTFRTVEGGGTMMVTSPGFRPDVVVLTGASKGPPAETGFAEGWSHGIAHRNRSGDIDQYAVSIADTGAETTGGGIREDAALDLPISAEGSGTDAVWGKVASVVDEGFQFEVSAPTGHDRSSTVQYHAISFPDGADVSVGTFGFGSEPRKGRVDLGVDADYVTLTATTGARPLTRDADRPVAISHGTIVGPADDPTQSVVGSVIDGEGGSCVARDGRAICLLHPGEDGIAGRTSMDVTKLGSTMRLTLEEIHEPAPVAFAVYAAVSMPDDVPVPETGLTRTPGPDRGARRRVEMGFAPSTVSLSATAGGLGDGARSVPTGLPMLGWSHGAIGGDPGGLAGQVPLRTLADGDRIVRNPLGVGFDDDAFVLAAMEEFEGELPLVLYTAWPGEVNT